MAQSSQRLRAPHRFAGPLAMVALGAAMLIPGASVSAAEPTDMVLQWNLNAVNAIGNAPTATTPGLGQVPPIAAINLAMVQGAIYDAVNAIDRTHKPYLLRGHAPADASQAAAAATAAHDVLVGLLPTMPPQVTASVDGLYAASLAQIPDGQAKHEGIVIGTAAAAVMLADRLGDGRDGTATWPVGALPGEWRPVPPLGNNVFGWIGGVRPFSLKRANQFRAAPPPNLGSSQYAREFNEVKALGAKTGSTRTPEQDALASWIVVNPFGQQNQTFRNLATSHNLSTAEEARLFAMTSFSTADALIDCFNQKGFYHFWRPQTAIQEADTDGNPNTTADPAWVSLFPTPGYPDMPSGYNCYTAANMTAARTFFGTDAVAFDVTNAVGTRSYTRFSGYIHDAIEGRILIGFHFRSADAQGASLGRKAAQWVTHHDFLPVD